MFSSCSGPNQERGAMPEADFSYAPANDVAGLPLSASIFADRAGLRDELRADVEAAGLAVHDCAPLAALFEGEPRALGEVVLVDCPQIDAGGLAALARRPTRLRELNHDDRLALLRLTEQIGEIAGRLERLAAPGLGMFGPGISDDGELLHFESP